MEGEEISNKSEHTPKSDIDLFELVKVIWSRRKFVYKVVAVSFSLGLFVAIGSKVEYKTECSFILTDNQSAGGLNGLISQFGGLAGVNLNDANMDGGLSPELFPTIVSSTPFMLKVLKSEIRIEKYDTTATLYNYLNKIENPSLIGYIYNYTFGLPIKLLNAIKKEDTLSIGKSNRANSDIIRLTKAQDELLDKLENKISIEFDSETGIVTLEVQLPDKVAVAQTAQVIYNLLTQYLVDYKISKAKADFDFINNITIEAKQRYEKAQEKLASFRDQNQNVSSSFFKTNQDRLQGEYQLAFNVYSGLAQQLEQSKIKVQDSMPVFKIVNNIQIPLEKCKPKRVIILLVSVILGGFLSVSWVLFTLIMGKFKTQL